MGWCILENFKLEVLSYIYSISAGIHGMCHMERELKKGEYMEGNM